MENERLDQKTEDDDSQDMTTTDLRTDVEWSRQIMNDITKHILAAETKREKLDVAVNVSMIYKYIGVMKRLFMAGLWDVCRYNLELRLLEILRHNDKAAEEAYNSIKDEACSVCLNSNCLVRKGM